MKIREIFYTNYANHNRTKVNRDNFFQWKMRYRHNQSKYNNASTHNNDKNNIAFEAIEPTTEPTNEELIKIQREEIETRKDYLWY